MQIAKVRGDCVSRGFGRMQYILVHNWQSQVTAISRYSSGRCFTSIRDRGDALHNKASMTQSAVYMVEYHNLPHIPLILFDTPWRVFKTWCLFAACLPLECNRDQCLFKAGLYSGKYCILPRSCCFAIHAALSVSYCVTTIAACQSRAV